VHIRLKVHAGAREDRVSRLGPAAYEVWVKAPAEQGKANEAVFELLSRELGHSRFRLVKGAKSPSKIIETF
jgi:uncharacterized protein YggU (UPF0235/DUF167 family)